MLSEKLKMQLFLNTKVEFNIVRNLYFGVFNSVFRKS